MKFEPFIHIRPGKVTAGMTLVDDKPRADMFMPAWMVSLGLLCTMFGVILGIVMVAVKMPFLLILLSAVLVVFGIATLMFWKNHKIHMLSDDEFRYHTWLGKKHVYRFDEIKDVKKAHGYSFLFIGERKVYIDSAALFTKRLSDRLNRRVEELHGSEQADC